MEKLHDTATECHLPYGITQCCYLLPDTSEHTPPSLPALSLSVWTAECWQHEKRENGWENVRGGNCPDGRRPGGYVQEEMSGCRLAIQQHCLAFLASPGSAPLQAVFRNFMILAVRTARSGIGYWHHNVVCLSVCYAVHCGCATVSELLQHHWLPVRCRVEFKMASHIDVRDTERLDTTILGRRWLAGQWWHSPTVFSCLFYMCDPTDKDVHDLVINHLQPLTSPAMGHWGTCPFDFQLFTFSGDFRAAQVAQPLIFDFMWLPIE